VTNKVEKIALFVALCVIKLRKQRQRQNVPDEKHLYREEKYASIYEINMLRCIFCGLCEDACPKDAIYLTTSKTQRPVMREKILYMEG
jgi:NADH-quinone oxidoreductase subunit I